MEPIQQIQLPDITAAIKSNRIAKHYSQEFMGQKLNISKKAYYCLEKGYTVLSLERFAHIAEILQLPLTDLMFPKQRQHL
jgi:transcriptional regulator with XRE-family HTH domain